VEDAGSTRKLSRRGFLKAAAGSAVGIALLAAGSKAFADWLSQDGGAGGASPRLIALASGSPSASPHPSTRPRRLQHFRSRPDLQPPLIDVDRRSGELAPGYLLFTPLNTPTIIDDQGQLVWYRPAAGVSAINLQRLVYRGQPVLTWWEGRIENGRGYGEYVLVDARYAEVARVSAGNGLKADLHELVLTDAGTALLIAYAPIPARKVTRPVGGEPTPSAASGQVYDAIVQEVDVASGGVLFEWHAADHIGLDESVESQPTEPAETWDYCHLNSIDVDRDGNLLLSARNTSAVYKVDRSSGRLIWRLGGRRSDFDMGADASFALQHDARRQADGTLTLFDDSQKPAVSRGIRLRLDERQMAAVLLAEYVHPRRFTTPAQGNMQVLDDGHVLIGWGSEPYLSEFAGNGTLVLDITFPDGDAAYRAFRQSWNATPVDRPALAIDATEPSAYVSWNGATAIHDWELVGGPSPRSLVTVARAPRTGFETRLSLPVFPPDYVAARALDASGAELGRSPTVRS
jgi:hypothetical protein